MCLAQFRYRFNRHPSEILLTWEKEHALCSHIKTTVIGYYCQRSSVSDHTVPGDTSRSPQRIQQCGNRTQKPWLQADRGESAAQQMLPASLQSWFPAWHRTQQVTRVCTCNNEALPPRELRILGSLERNQWCVNTEAQLLVSPL